MNRRTAYGLALVLFVALVSLKFSPHTGFSSLIRFGETWNERRHSSLQALPVAIVPLSNGYDGQFYAQIALDPSLRDIEFDRVIDAPAYRARRILAPAMAALLGWGNPWWTIQAYALINVCAWLAFAWLLHRHIGDTNWIGYARWIGCMFSMGALESVRQSLVDLPALLALFLAVEAHNRTQYRSSTTWLTLGNLAKETSLLSALALSVDPSNGKLPWRRSLISLGACALPPALWSLYVNHRFPISEGSTGLGNFTLPLMGLLEHLKTCAAAILSGNLDGRYSMGLLAALGFLVQILVLWRTPLPRSAWWRIGVTYSLLFVFLSPWVWSGYWAASRAVLPMTIAFNLLLPPERHFWPLWALGNLTILHAIWRFL
jgi:hypothetical protein